MTEEERIAERTRKCEQDQAKMKEQLKEGKGRTKVLFDEIEEILKKSLKNKNSEITIRDKLLLAQKLGSIAMVYDELIKLNDDYGLDSFKHKCGAAHDLHGRLAQITNFAAFNLSAGNKKTFKQRTSEIIRSYQGYKRYYNYVTHRSRR